MIDGVKSFTEVDGYGYCAEWWSFLVEAGDYVVSELV